MPQNLTESSKHFKLSSTWGQGTIMDYGPLQRFTGSMQYMAGRADLWSWSYTGGSGFYGSSLVGGPAHVAPGSAGDWAVGVRGYQANVAVMSLNRARSYYSRMSRSARFNLGYTLGKKTGSGIGGLVKAYNELGLVKYEEPNAMGYGFFIVKIGDKHFGGMYATENGALISYTMSRMAKNLIGAWYALTETTLVVMDDGAGPVGSQNIEAYIEAEIGGGQNKGLLVNPSSGIIRGTDSAGSGYYGAPRGNRVHKGIDIIAMPGQSIVSPVDGRAVNFIGATLGKPIVDITPSNSDLGIDKIRMLYVNAPSNVNAWVSYDVKAGQSVGNLADLVKDLHYPEGITQHVHVQVMVEGKWVDPTPYFFQIKNKLCSI